MMTDVVMTLVITVITVIMVIMVIMVIVVIVVMRMMLMIRMVAMKRKGKHSYRKLGQKHPHTFKATDHDPN